MRCFVKFSIGVLSVILFMGLSESMAEAQAGDRLYDSLHQQKKVSVDKEEPGDRTAKNKFYAASNMKTVFAETISGIVTDAQSGETLPGVNILVKGTSTGASTDADGQYELEVESLQDTLVVSFVGYKTQEVPINGRNQIDIALQSQTITGEEMVVVGYGTHKEKNIVGSIKQKNIEDLSSRSTGSFARSMQGQVAGLNLKSGAGRQGGDPSAPLKINIRGFNSINGGSPLVLVDGVEQDLEYVNPNDVKSITVLKDAEAAAIYGSKGAFGVVLVTTKKGKAGELEIEYSNNIGTSTTATRTDFLTNPYRYAQLVDHALFPRSGPAPYSTYSGDDWDKIKAVANGEREPFMEENPDGTHKFFYETNWWRLHNRKWRPHQTHNLAVSGGSAKLNGRFSARYHRRTKIQNFQTAPLKRYNVGTDLNFKPFKWIKLSFNGKYAQNFNKRVGGTKNGYSRDFSASKFRDEFAFYPAFVDGIPTNIGRSHNGYVGRLASEYAGGTYKEYTNKNYITSLSARLNPIKGLDFNFDYSFNWNNFTQPTKISPFVDLKGSELKKTTEGVSRYSERHNNTYLQTFNVYGHYSTDVGNTDKHHFELTLGMNEERSKHDEMSAEMRDLISDDISNFALGTQLYNIDGGTTDWTTLGYFGRFNYNYDNRYLFEVNARYDGSSRFPEGDRFGLFPSAGASWRVSNEKFWTSAIKNIIPTLKLRVSYGQLGNQEVPVNTFRSLVGFGKNDGWYGADKTRVNYARVPSPLPANIGWETVTSTNFGVDFGFLDDKLTASLDAYQRETSNMYLPGQPLPAVFGTSAPRENFATLRNRGIEISIGYRNNFKVLGSQLSFNISANTSNFKGKITKYKNPSKLISSYYEGQTIGSLWGYHVDGQFQSDKEAAAYEKRFSDPSASSNLNKVYKIILDKSDGEWGHLRAGDVKYVDLNGDGKIDDGNNTLDDPGDRRIIGNGMPKFPFGFNINANWKSFDISIIGQGVAHQDWYPLSQIYWATFSRPYSSYIRKDLVDHMWDPDASDNSDNYYPQEYRGYTANNGNAELRATNDRYIENLGYLRIKNMTIGYTLPIRLSQKVNIKKLRFYVSAENWFTWRFGDLTKYIDPEVAGGHISYSDPGKATAQGDRTANPYPMTKTIAAGIQIKL